MKQIVEVRGVQLGAGIPKICVSLTGKNNKELMKEIVFLKTLKIDIVEWRMDYHQEVEKVDRMEVAVEEIREALGEMPLLATFRSKKEGGEQEVSTTYYMELNQRIAATGKVDMVDVELFTGEQQVEQLVEALHSQEVKVVMSNHDFYKTPSKEEIINRLCKMQEMKADIPKIAVMPQNAKDVLTLLDATQEMVSHYADRPIITMSMAGLGVISRLSGEVFGSAVTFAAAKTASAPGQIAVEKLMQVLEIVHENNK